jgi:hypothetical protein
VSYRARWESPRAINPSAIAWNVRPSARSGMIRPAWLGHASKAFTMATYVHSQPEALTLAAQS